MRHGIVQSDKAKQVVLRNLLQISLRLNMNVGCIDACLKKVSNRWKVSGKDAASAHWRQWLVNYGTQHLLSAGARVPLMGPKILFYL